jgi:hypothetical protein
MVGDYMVLSNKKKKIGGRGEEVTGADSLTLS